MTLTEFGAVVRQRIPTPAEFVAVVRGQKWSIEKYPDGRAAIRADKKDPLAVALAKMLSREPYRTNVLKIVDDGPPAAKKPEPKKVEPVANDYDKYLRFYQMKSGQIHHRIEGKERDYPPYGAEAWSMSALGPWQDLGGTWRVEECKAIWSWA